MISVVQCPNCGRLSLAKGKRHRCPYCGRPFLISPKSRRSRIVAQFDTEKQAREYMMRFIDAVRSNTLFMVGWTKNE